MTHGFVTQISKSEILDHDGNIQTWNDLSGVPWSNEIWPHEIPWLPQPVHQHERQWWMHSFSLAVFSGQFLCSDIIILPWARWENVYGTFSSTYPINPFDWNASNIVISDFGYCSIPEMRGLLHSDVQVIPFPRDTICNDDTLDPRLPLYGWYAQVICTNGIQCCFNYRQRIHSEQMTGLIASQSKTMYNTCIYTWGLHTNKTFT
jgi:hypothetical protein